MREGWYEQKVGEGAGRWAGAAHEGACGGKIGRLLRGLKGGGGGCLQKGWGRKKGAPAESLLETDIHSLIFLFTYLSRYMHVCIHIYFSI